MPRPFRLLAKSFDRFIAHDGWAIASHIALSVLMSMFPFLILLTALAGLFGSEEIANEAAGLILEAWPREVAAPIAGEIRNVLTAVRGDALLIGSVLSLYFASSGVEALRIGLNRAYEAYEWRAWWLTRIESIGFVVASALAMIAFAFLIVLFPLGWRTFLRWVPAAAPVSGAVSVALGLSRIAVASAIIVAALIIAHRLLPAGRMSFRAILPGILFTLGCWMLGGFVFGAYLDSFAGAYVTTYAGLATAMIALVFLYLLSAIFLLGAELNGAIEDEQKPRPKVREALSTF